MRLGHFTPVLARIFGCSFLPDHDYGQGGRVGGILAGFIVADSH